ncbi:RagB/SusD family nutrient uptake outer membrane protein [Sinomicrobium weinanense]|uniref:SusD/RagB family nutrient-binding outer membrane lipoprotein n=1 Tax=Sinomicrobium weinanense TaxID=2842200 RepID=A0A926JP38_9FLAO|nr:RagB/SusD family nutrient uptake outer membrane protein [Sinomicrobium weinanense]MBC9794682.1 SusD/RagB family nutrient-binding outer membrane lipoprotein [Sinomicrobium weinanense]MBU3124167.1 SusD/RagB family nutrient-binding outer membrane lipoprotein [Sinomicrobium weinanense]
MKKSLYVISMSIVLLVTGCTGDFDDLNKDPDGFTNEEFEQDNNLMGTLCGALLQWGIPAQENSYQVGTNLSADVFSGYMMSPNPFNGNQNNTNYALIPSWNEETWNKGYREVMARVLKVEQFGGEEKFPEFYAWALILRVAAMHRVADFYGPMVYSQYGKGESDNIIPYDSQEQVYDAFFMDLDKAVGILTESAAQGDDTGKFERFDISTYKKSGYEAWIRFANSLRLRLAMRIVKVDPDRARTEAESAVNQKYGVIQDNSDNLLIVSEGSFRAHPLQIISTEWLDTRMGAPMESFLKGYDDPRIGVYFKPSKEYEGEYKGIRSGIAIDSKGTYQDFSAIGDLIEKPEIQWMNAAEVYFLRAEGALRGWNMGGDARSFYESGIKSSFEQYGLGGSEDYVANAESRPQPYVDPKNDENNVEEGSPYLSNATIQWEGAATNEEKLEKIITQKWLAIYPNGAEAWSEFRRTGYPKLFPVVINNSGGNIASETFIRRLPFPQSERQNNASELEKALSFLKGPDNGGTRLWWDVEGGNF